MKNVLDILKYFGYSDPIKAYKSLPIDKFMDLIHKYYILNPMKT